jgi:aminocarboxymuconate-semialdehyde decarboxylase
LRSGPHGSAQGVWKPGQLADVAPAAEGAADSLGADRLVLGTDFPYQTGAAYERAVSYLTTSGLAPGDAGRMLSANAQALLGLRDEPRIARM